MGIDVAGLGAVADLAKSVVSRIWPDKTEQEKAEMTMALQAMSNEMQITQGQVDINKVEAASDSLFKSGWRPAIGWVCAIALFYQYLVRPLAGGLSAAFGHPLPPFPGLDDNLWQLMLGMLGLGGLRSIEKSKGIASK